jgi:hypothetical protein
MLTQKELDALDAMIDEELKGSDKDEAYKQALKERLIIRAEESSEIKAIRGLEEGTGKKRQKIMLLNGLVVNADAFDD